MKKMILLLSIAIVAFSLSGCSALKKNENLAYDCFNCGFEFEYETSESSAGCSDLN